MTSNITMETDISQSSFDSGISVSGDVIPYNCQDYRTPQSNAPQTEFFQNDQNYNFSEIVDQIPGPDTYYEMDSENYDPTFTNLDQINTGSDQNWSNELLSAFSELQNGFSQDFQQQEMAMQQQTQNYQQPFSSDGFQEFQQFAQNSSFSWNDLSPEMFGYQPQPIPEQNENVNTKKRGRKRGRKSTKSAEEQCEKPKRKRVITTAQRQAANVRERKRMVTLNQAFEGLKKKIPLFNYENKLSRIETLKMAIVYISFMQEILSGVPLNSIKLTQFLEPLPLSVSRKTLPDVYL